jgi:hypothetical protein
MTGDKKQTCKLHMFRADPSQLEAKGGRVRLSWISENCGGCRFMLDIPGAGQTDVSSVESYEVSVKRETVFTLRVYSAPPSNSLLWQQTTKVSVHKIWS